jgi:PAS domain S-box-containing protein
VAHDTCPEFAFPPNAGVESALPNSQWRLSRLLDKIPAGAYTCDAQGRITYYNQPAAQLWGRAPKLNSNEDRFCGSFRLFAADGLPIDHDRSWMALALKTGQVYNCKEIVIQRPDASCVTVLAHARAFRDQAGEIVGAMNILVDISQRKLAEESQARLAAIVESSDDAIVGKSLGGQILSWNGGAERIFGYTAAEAIGRHITLIIPPERHEEERSILARLARGERVEHFETVRVTKDGRRIDVSLTTSPVRDGSGRIVGASKVARDITARKHSEQERARLYAQLQELDRRKDEFLAALSHELRNPLAPLSNSLQLLRLSGDLSPAVEHVRAIMENQVNHLVRLVDDLLDASRITRGKVELRKQRVELAALVTSAVEASRPIIDAAGHQLAISVAPEPLLLDADPVRLVQVLVNLLNNAAKYTENGGQIWLAARASDGYAAISVRDTGVGIPAEVLPRVFDMFSQVDRTLSRAQGGLGIGLALARRFVEMHGGRIEVQSGGPGMGSEFVVYLPRVQDQRPLAIEAAPPIHRPPLPAHRILVVDDTPAAGYILASLLEAIGQRVCTLPDALSAWEAARANRPEVVFADINMPGVDGYELARRLRAEPSLAGVVLVAVTGYGQEQDRELARQAGFNHHLVKPVSYESLYDLLASLPLSPVPHPTQCTTSAGVATQEAPT